MKERNSNIELLRIIAMVLIVLTHNYFYTTWPGNNSNSFGEIFSAFFSFGGKFGVNIFFLISGFFLYGKKYRISRVINLELISIFYSILLGFIATIYDHHQISWKIFFPTFTNTYWFSTSLIIIYLFSGVMFWIMDKINIKIINFLFFTSLFILYILPTFVQSFPKLILINSAFVFIVGALVKKYKFYDYISMKFLKISIFLFLFALIIGNFFELIGFINYDWEFSEYYSIFPFMSSLTVFCFSLKLNIKRDNKINFFAGLMYGVYLFHENPFVRNFLWNSIWPLSKYSNSYFFVVSLLGKVSIIFLLGIFFEIIRNFLFKSLKNYTQSKLSGYIYRSNDN